MGSFIYYPPVDIPQEKREEFIQRMRKILDFGGMMDIQYVKFSDISLPLLRPIREMQGRLDFAFNYFEDSNWEDAGFDPQSCRMGSGKIGSFEFNDVMRAATMLFELYDSRHYLATNDGYFVEADKTIGWLNHLFGTQYGLGKRKNLWACIETNIWPDQDVETRNIYDIIPPHWRKAVCSTDVADLLYIASGTHHLKDQTLRAGTYPADILNCRVALEKYFEGKGKDSCRGLWEFLKLNYEERAQTTGEFEEIAQLTLHMPARVFIYLAAELQGAPFRKLWPELSVDVYRDEKMAQYADTDLQTWRKARMDEPVPPIRTCDYLVQTSVWAFWGTPDELKDKPRYYISDDDRLYWWDVSDEVLISEETDAWLKKLAVRHREIVEKISASSNQITQFKDFMQMLVEIHKYFYNLLPIESMFYEFVDHLSQVEYAAGIELIKQLSEQEDIRAAGDVVRKVSPNDLDNKNVLGNEGRLQIKRLYAAFANKKLRNKYFGF